MTGILRPTNRSGVATPGTPTPATEVTTPVPAAPQGAVDRLESEPASGPRKTPGPATPVLEGRGTPVGPRGTAARDALRIPLRAGETAQAALERHFGHPVPRALVEQVERGLTPGATLIELRPLAELYAADRGLEPDQLAQSLPGATYIVASPRPDWQALVREHYGKEGLSQPAVDGLVMALRAINQVGGPRPRSVVALPDLATLDRYLAGMRRAAEVTSGPEGAGAGPRPGQDYTAFAGESPVDLALAAYASQIAAAPSADEAAALALRLTLGLIRKNRGRDLDGGTLTLHVPTFDEAMTLGTGDGEKGGRLREIIHRRCASALVDARAQLSGTAQTDRLTAIDAARSAIVQARVQRALEQAGDGGMAMFGWGFMIALSREFNDAPPREPRDDEDPQAYVRSVFGGLRPDQQASVLTALGAHRSLLQFLERLGEHAGVLEVACPKGMSTADAIVAELLRRDPRLPPATARQVATTLARYSFEVVGTRVTDHGPEEIRRFTPRVSFISAADVVIHASDVTTTKPLSGARRDLGAGHGARGWDGDAGWDADLWRDALHTAGSADAATEAAEAATVAAGGPSTVDLRASAPSALPGAAAAAAEAQEEQVLSEQRRSAARLAAVATGAKDELDELAQRNRASRSAELRADPTDPRPVRRR